MLAFPAITVAACNGHVGAGASVLGAALEIAEANANKHRPTLATIKRTAYAPVLELLAKHATEES